MNRIFVGREATQHGSFEVTLDTEREWADPPGEGSAMTFANLVEEAVLKAQIAARPNGYFGPQPMILRASWVPVYDEQLGVTFVLSYLFRTSDGVLHAALALEQG